MLKFLKWVAEPVQTFALWIIMSAPGFSFSIIVVKHDVNIVVNMIMNKNFINAPTFVEWEIMKKQSTLQAGSVLIN